MKITEKIVNVQTDEETIIEREETQSETEARLKREAEIAAALQIEQEKNAARKALLAKLGITEEEAKLLLS